MTEQELREIEGIRNNFNTRFIERDSYGNKLYEVKGEELYFLLNAIPDIIYEIRTKEREYQHMFDNYFSKKKMLSLKNKELEIYISMIKKLLKHMEKNAYFPNEINELIKDFEELTEEGDD